jgi:hypothetical protein
LGIILALGFTSSSAQATNLINLNFNNGVDSLGNSQGNLIFNGLNGFQVTFTDDNSSGSFGGNANGVHITNLNAGNIKVGTNDLVLGAFNTFINPSENYHSSGIVANFNQGVASVRFDDTDNDGTVKALFAFDENGVLIGQTPFASQIPVMIDTSLTGGKLIYSIEFDTARGTAGGSFDFTVFTINNFSVEGVPPVQPPKSVPESSPLFGLGAIAVLGVLSKLSKKTKSPTDKLQEPDS